MTGRRNGELQSLETQYFLSSLNPDEVSASTFQNIILRHWEVENCLHWQKDRYFEEDKHALGEGGDVWTVLTNIAVSLKHLLRRGERTLLEVAERCLADPTATAERLGFKASDPLAGQLCPYSAGIRRDFLCRSLAGVNAVRYPNTIEIIAAKSKCRLSLQFLFQLPDQLAMAQMVLRHRLRPMGGPDMMRVAVDLEDSFGRVRQDWHQPVVRHVGHLR